MDRKLRHAVIVVSSYILLYCLFFSPVLFSGRILAIADSLSLYLPSFMSPVSLWEPDLLGGFPVAADLQNATWYPIARLFSIFQFWNGFVISGYVLLSCFSYAYVYFLTKSWVGAAVSGIVAGMSGFAMAHFGHTIIVHGMVWIPLVLLVIEKLKIESGPIWFVIGSVAIALSLLSGHPQIPAYGLIIAGFYALTLGLSISNHRIRFFIVCAGMFIAGSALTAIQMVPLFELVSQSLREEPDISFFLSLPLKPLGLTTLFFPALFGTPDSSLYSYPYFGPMNFIEKSGYTGLVTMLLSFVGIQRYKEKPLVWFWVFILIIALLLTLGDVFPFARWVFSIPGLRNFRVPARHLFEMTLAMSFLAGFGAAGIHQRLTTQKSILWSVISGGILIVIAGAAIRLNSMKIEKMALKRGVTDLTLAPWANLAIIIPIILFCIATFVLFFSIRKPSTFRVSILLGALIFDLASIGFFCDWKLAPEKVVLTLPQTLKDIPENLQKTHQRFFPVRGVRSKPEEGKPNLTRLWSIPSGSGYGSLILKRTSDLFSMPPEGNLTGNWMASPNRSLDLMAVRYVSARDKPDQAHGDRPGKRWRLVREFGSSVILENRRAMPRAWLVSRVMRASGLEVRNAILNSILPGGTRFRPEDIALVEEDFSFEGKEDPKPIVRIIKIETSSMEIHVETEYPAFLVVSDTYYSGWTAKVNGASTHLYRTNYLFRGLLVPSGSNTIRMEYKPASFRLGFIITAGSFLLIAFVGAWPIMRKTLVKTEA